MRSWRSSPTRACRSSRTRASSSSAPASAAGLAVEVLPGPSAALAALVASALPSDRWRFGGFLPRKRERAGGGVRRRPRRSSCSSPPSASAPRWRCSRSIDPERPVALCRELTKLHEEIVRGRAAELAERYATQEPRGEVVLVIGAAPAAAGRHRPGARRRPPARRRRAKPRAAAGVVAELTGIARQRALPRAHGPTTRADSRAHDSRCAADDRTGSRPSGTAPLRRDRGSSALLAATTSQTRRRTASARPAAAAATRIRRSRRP